MKFKIRRTSCWDEREDNPPCKRVTLERVDRIDTRYFETFEQHDKKLGHMNGSWVSQGTDHKVLVGATRDGKDMIQRTFPKDHNAWIIEINSLEELLELSAETESELIISGETIEIYDDYRE